MSRRKMWASAARSAVAISAVAVLAAVSGLGSSAAVPLPSAVPLVIPSVPAYVETVPVLGSGDAADDPAVWRNPSDPAASLLIGNDKKGALDVYTLDGARIQRITSGGSFWGNVDVRQDVTIAGLSHDVIAAYNGGLRLFDVDPDTLELFPTTEGSTPINSGWGEGVCLYRSRNSGSLYAMVISIAGRVRQFEITDADSDGLLSGTLRREFQVGSEAEGCVADDETGDLYISEEDVGLWRYGAEPASGTTRSLLDTVTPTGRLAPDVEGVTLVALPGGQGYVIASAQNVADPRNSYFVAYERGSGDYVGAFRVVPGTRADGCSRTDGITALAQGLGPDFPNGVFVCQDDQNSLPGTSGYQDFKLVPLESILSLWEGAPPPPPPVGAGSFVGATSTNANRTVHSVTMPAGIQAGDALVVFMAWNTPANVLAPPGGWVQVGAVGDSSMTARAWTRVATSADINTTVSVTLSAISKADLSVAAYRGLEFGVAQGVLSGAGATVTTATTSATEPAWVVSYWADKSSSNSALTPPASQVPRTSSTGSGGGRITAALADSGAPIGPGIVGGLSALGASAHSRAASFTTLLNIPS